jgi:hypothetical protein
MRLAEPTLGRHCEWLVVSAFEERAKHFFEKTNTKTNSRAWHSLTKVCTGYDYVI